MAYEKDLERFWRKVDKSPGHGPNGDCWIWIAAKTGAMKYGAFFFTGKQTGAHRAIWQMTNNEILTTLDLICHTCDLPACVNPIHLFKGNHRINTLDMIAKGRGGGAFRRKIGPLGTAWCCNCKQFKPDHLFYANPRAWNGLRHTCIECCLLLVARRFGRIPKGQKNHSARDC